MAGTPGNAILGSLDVLRGVGRQRMEQLSRLGIRTVGDLLAHRPRRYEDRRHILPIASVEPGQSVLVKGRVVASGIKRWKRGSRSVFELILDDGSARLHCRWWNLPYMQSYFQLKDEVLAFGRIESLRPRTIDHPETEVVREDDEPRVHLNRLVPIYGLTEGLPQRWLRSLVWRVLEEHADRIEDPWSPYMPASLEARGLNPADRSQAPFSRSVAIRRIHFPEETADIERARRRLALDEFIALQLEIQARRRRLRARARALPCSGNNRLIRPYLRTIGFRLTGAQTRVLREIRSDLGRAEPMRRLLQGDVGSGKTVVAACSALMALESGCHVVLMAPTEILAEQHHRVFQQWLQPLGISVGLWTSARKTLPRSEPEGAPQMVIGTHALLEESFHVPKLGLVIIDEQHRFGVAQREQLLKKGSYPHLLVMTATPIPRTLGLTLYGDLDVSVIDQLPRGRGRVRTFIRTADRMEKVIGFMRGKLREGRQAYVIYPRVEDSGSSELKAATVECERLRLALAPHSVALIHGRQAAHEKEATMRSFREGAIHVLVATSVIEVGVDVPNATVMVIENAGRFGLAQLHQMRGRIGRGAHDSQCILMVGANLEEAARRLKVLEETTDGFRIAEEDLRLRGPGELIGKTQSGMPSFRYGDLVTDTGLIELARDMAGRVLERRGAIAGTTGPG